jgi:DNA modification methylase
MAIVMHFGDSAEFLLDLADKSVDAIITDPPYDFNEVTKAWYQAQFTRISKGAVIVFCPPENQWQRTCDQWLFWVKPISTKNTSKSYSRFVEMIQVWNGSTWDTTNHWSHYTNVFTDLVDGRLHPYQKPVSMMTRLVRNHTKPGDLVLDPFAGSATTGVSCFQTGRRFLGIEKELGYYTEACLRLEDIGAKVY